MEKKASHKIMCLFIISHIVQNEKTKQERNLKSVLEATHTHTHKKKLISNKAKVSIFVFNRFGVVVVVDGGGVLIALRLLPDTHHSFIATYAHSHIYALFPCHKQVHPISSCKCRLFFYSLLT